ncbi:hypothetical protein [Actibacterium sp. 188UL27-1]|uniref:hypothetical protein n=1 Tax=Actibacterium sp. 188UL27-1 TaxID=2786961 RepID=UPI00195D0636|nr:hypothetical protein [Actibacterium sp. 188UL27-1]MBM7069215.1 hypothetical protein [Actibacterium sp. 188UL27-1]
MRKISITFAMVFGSTGALAAADFVTAGDAGYNATCNASGAILMPVNPARSPLYLGATCDAFDPAIGDGTWGWSEAGFVAQIYGSRFPFPKQQPPCLDDPQIGQAMRACTEPPIVSP